MKFVSILAGAVLVVGASFGYADHGHVANSFRSRRAPLEMTVTQRG